MNFAWGWLVISISACSAAPVHVDGAACTGDCVASPPSFEALRVAMVGLDFGAPIIADFTSDGRADVVLGPPGAAFLLRGNGDGTFGTAVAIESTNTPLPVLADFDGDGNFDLLTLGLGGALVPLISHGDGTFSAWPSLQPGGYDSIAVADWNGDGRADVATVFDNEPSCFFGQCTPDLPGSVEIFLSQPSGGFAASQTIPSSRHPSVVVAVDVNNDHRLDLAIGGGDVSFVSILLGDGHGAFAASTSAPIPYAALRLVAGDWNGDGNADLSTPDGQLLGHGTGGFSYVPIARRVAAVMADFNGDHRSDLVAVDGADLDFYLGSAAGLSAPFAFALGKRGSLGVGDVDGDGRPDLVSLAVNDDLTSDRMLVLLNRSR